MVTSNCGRYVYHICIIDFCQLYNSQKKMERLVKRGLLMFRLNSDYTAYDLSTIDPKRYRDRFLKFCSKEVFKFV